ncbi:hypothetical protein HYU14_01040 [Candidatus Woesearchaeota archaeon]|nr:hypothetical protein [Candidatus Woesearchaeota archaeon]
MAKKAWLIVFMAVVLLIALMAYLFYPKKPYYSDDPKDWVEDKGKGVREINVDKATGGAGYVDFNGLQYETGTIGTVFAYDGWYHGSYFREEYADLDDGKVLMRISPQMKPYDGIIEGFMVEKVIDEKPYVYIFLDEDWRKSVFNTTVFWGKFHQSDKEFNFSFEASKGIYMDWVEDDMERFENGYNIHDGGVWVGEIREDRNSTLISLT